MGFGFGDGLTTLGFGGASDVDEELGVADGGGSHAAEEGEGHEDDADGGEEDDDGIGVKHHEGLSGEKRGKLRGVGWAA